ncbi:hypothetical protein [Mesorhizobium sp. CN2-181]|uniref:hypothetical protein n=1 Tax=Mesorhizobium yinganensis TaxID=3157707 RepID=UPI0032B7EDD5
MLNRRKLLATTPAVLAAVVTPAAACFGTSDPDAELIRLGAIFDRLYEDWKPLWREMDRAHNRWAAAMHERGTCFGEDMDALFASQAEFGVDIAGDRNNAHLDKVEAAAAPIRVMQPKTLAGLAVRARVCRFDSASLPEIDRPRGDWDWATECLECFIADIERMAATS